MIFPRLKSSSGIARALVFVALLGNFGCSPLSNKLIATGLDPATDTSSGDSGVSGSGSTAPVCTAQPAGLVSAWDGTLSSGGTLANDWKGSNIGNAGGVSSASTNGGSSFSISTNASSISVPDSPSLDFSTSMSVAAWVSVNAGGTLGASRVIASKGDFSSTMSAGNFTSYDASNTDGAGGNKGYVSAVFDGRYVYFVPSSNASGVYSGEVLRYDTRGSYSASGSWASYDAGNTDGAGKDKYYAGAVFDGRYIYFVPYRAGTQVLRYDTLGAFTTPASWSSYDASNTDGTGNSRGYAGAVFDGRYIYFAPFFNSTLSGEILRYDTQSPFSAGSSWTYYDARSVGGSATSTVGFEGAVFDGRYIYFVPDANLAPGFTGDGIVLRYDTQGAFTSSASWTSFDASNTNGTGGDVGFIGAVFDGRYVYFVPYFTVNVSGHHGNVLRYDTKATFTSAASWSSYDASNTDGIGTNVGYKGATFDGRYIYFMPYAVAAAGKILRYDTAGGFNTAGSWSSFDSSNTNGSGGDVGYTGGVYDGRYVYFAPLWNATAGFHGNVLRYDTHGPSSSSFQLESSHVSSDGFSSSVLGPTFQITTSNGTYSVASTARLSSAWHHVAGIYDGSAITLYVDGLAVATAPASGSLVVTSNSLNLGSFGSATASFDGLIQDAQVYGEALVANDVAALFAGGVDGVCR